MTELRLDTWEMPAASPGIKSSLPIFHPARRPHGERHDFHESVTEEDRKYIGFGGVPGPLPYRLQVEYDRQYRPRAFRTAVLENDILRATFLLELGGRLWSLVHKPSRRELLYVNPVFQPGHLGVRQAWFSGGVEWNCGVHGHTPLTCSPMFAARLEADDGTPILRLYEFERIRCLAYQMDFSLPDRSHFLHARMRVLNPHDRDTPIYWWSNIAVPEVIGSRVVVPAHAALKFNYRGMISRVPIPVADGRDLTYPTRMPRASDDFYFVDNHPRPWITYLGRDGAGLVQASTPRLRGRKLFRWGMHPGGRHWSDFLSGGDGPYIEIQAGLARSQAECLPMPPRTEWNWLEAYGLLEVDPAPVHGKDWPTAVAAVETRLHQIMPADELERQLAAGAGAADRPPDEILHRGSGWGALERRRREKHAEPPFCSGALVFDDASLDHDQAPWLELLERGGMPAQDPAREPGALMVQPEWRRLLDESVTSARSDHWLAWWHLGVMAYYAQDVEAARAAWRTSLERAPSAWAWRNLAVAAAHEKDLAEAVRLYRTARELAPDFATLAVECLKMHLRAKRSGELLDLLAALPPAVRAFPRVLALEAEAALNAGDLDRAARLLEHDLLVVADVAEGELSLSDLWFRLHEQRIARAEGVAIDEKLRQRVEQESPPPYHLDFRMAPPGE